MPELTADRLIEMCRRKPIPSSVIRYGLLDDEGSVIRWVECKPVGREYVTKRTPVPKIEFVEAPF